jgi:hypothetical protein
VMVPRVEDLIRQHQNDNVSRAAALAAFAALGRP